MRGFTPVAGDGTLYVSGLVSVDYDANFPTQSYGGFGLYEGTQERFLHGQLYESAVYGAATPNAFASATSNVAIGDAQVVYLVTKLDQQANTVSLWVSPDLSQMEGDVPADVVFAYGASEDTVDTLRLRGGLASTGNTWSYDNLSVFDANAVRGDSRADDPRPCWASAGCSRWAGGGVTAEARHAKLMVNSQTPRRNHPPGRFVIRPGRQLAVENDGSWRPGAKFG